MNLSLNLSSLIHNGHIKRSHHAQDEKPQNGLKGLKYWRQDVLAGLQVSFIALPVSLGIALASGAPATAGIISAIIAGFVFPLIGGSFVTIAGPAAGLAPSVLAGILTLGQGNLLTGYHLILAVIIFAGLLQIVLSFLGVGKIVRILPIAVVEGMLSAIGFTIIMQQLPRLLGSTQLPEKSVLLTIKHLPSILAHISPHVALLGGALFVLLYMLQHLKEKGKMRGICKYIPVPLIVVCIGIIGGAVLHVPQNFLIVIPKNILQAIVFPDFAHIFSTPSIWGEVLRLVIVLTIIDSTESLATVSAVDRIDPYKRRSNPSRILFAMGISNLASSFFGGLTLIPEGIRSKANIESGAKTLWSNTYAALFLLFYIVAGQGLMSHIPLAALAALLVYIGWKLCEPRVLQHVLRLGNDQFLIYVLTFLSIIYTDLLTGVVIGVVAYIIFLFYLLTPSIRYLFTGDLKIRYFVTYLWKNAKHIFGNPVLSTKKVVTGSIRKHETVLITLGSLSSFNLLFVEQFLRSLPHHLTVDLIFSSKTKIVDHSAMAYVHYVKDLWGKENEDRIIIKGLKRLKKFSPHPMSGAYNVSLLEKEHFILREEDNEEVMFS